MLVMNSTAAVNHIQFKNKKNGNNQMGNRPHTF